MSRFEDFRKAQRNEYVVAGKSYVPILGYGSITLWVEGVKGPRKLRLRDVAYCQDFQCNLVSFDRLKEAGYYWDTRKELIVRDNETMVCKLTIIHRQRVLEYIPLSTTSQSSAFATRSPRRVFRPSRDPRRPESGDSKLWHLRMGHISQMPLHMLGKQALGMKLRGPCTIACQDCAMAKIRRQTSRRSPDRELSAPCQEIHVDWTDVSPDYQGFVRVMFITCAWSGMVFPYFMTTHGTEKENLRVLKDFTEWILKRYNLKVLVIRSDNELNRGRTITWMRDQGITFEPSAPETHDQNGRAERSGGVIMEKSRAMRIGAKLPHNLWVETVNSATYLFNRTPRYSNSWKTPYELFYSYTQGVASQAKPRKPQIAHLKAYGCRAYAMTKDAQVKKNRLFKLNPRAHIGYLIGYDSTNIFRIWIPHQGKVISTRDVIFDETTFFDGQTRKHSQELITELNILVQEVEIPEKMAYNERILQDDDEVVSDWYITENMEPINDLRANNESSDSKEDHDQECDPDTIVVDTSYPLPPLSESEQLASFPVLPVRGRYSTWSQHQGVGLSPQIQYTETTGFQDRKISAMWQGAFEAGTRFRVHKRNLPPAPISFKQLATHMYGKQFQEAQRLHLAEHEKMKTFQEVPKARAKGQQILDCMWVFTYKLDKHHFLQKCKARLVVCGNQQAPGCLPTRATTLASTSFRTIIALASYFDLETRQLDVVNAFVNCELDEVVYIKPPPGLTRPGVVFLLQKALYGLRRSPILWQRKLEGALRSQGLVTLAQEPCIAMGRGVVVIYYVDDIVFLYHSQHKPRVDQYIKGLKDQFEITDHNEMKWFLGVHIVRNRKQRKIWLSHKAYIEKLATQFQIDTTARFPTSPMAGPELVPFSGPQASPRRVQEYQRMTGSLLFSAVTTRPDIAFASSKLAQFNSNPGPEHHEAAVRVLRYLYGTREMAISYGYGVESMDLQEPQYFICASDASFADNSTDRKSSQGYIMKLFGGPIAWKANKQDTVTTSSTEAELLALSQTTKEALFLSRLFHSMQLELDQQLVIQCDNRQTIRLITEESAKLQTKLRHVDIHNHWLRQEHAAGRVQVKWIRTIDMIADGMTKSLSKEKHSRFLDQLGFEHIGQMLAVEKRMEEIRDEFQKKKLEEQREFELGVTRKE